MRCALHFCLLFLLGASAISPEVSLAALRLNEILPAPGSDWNGDLDLDSKADEWIEIVNSGSSACDLSGYLLLNGSGRARVYGFTGTIAPGEFIVVNGTDAVAWERDNDQSAVGLSLNNSGDVVWLVQVSDGDTIIVDSLSYSSGDVGHDVSIARVPDAWGAWTFLDHFLPMGGADLDPTPFASNQSDPPPHIFEIVRDPLFPTPTDSVHMIVEAGDASGITRVLLAYDINLEDGEEPEMELVSGTEDLGTWLFTILPCSAGDTVHYRFSLYDANSATITPWMGYRVRSGGLGVVINEILADPPADAAGDANRDGVRDAADDEFVEIVNCGSTAVDISGWKISDGNGARHVFPDTGAIITPGEFVTVFGGGSPSGFVGKVFTASSGGLGLANSGDLVSLQDEDGLLVDIHSYGSEGGKDQSMILYPDCSGDWMLPSEAGLESAFTPHQLNDGSSGVAARTWGGIKALFRPNGSDL
jgi:hypothetical protein